VIRALREGLASDRVQRIFGIVNGTSNYILSEMAGKGRAFAEVLADAQKLGYAEADPTLDVGGGDAAHKLAILIMLCFGTTIDVGKIFVEGIQRLDPIDFEYADRFGYVIKPLVIAAEHESGIEARVHPAMVPKNWLLASVPGAKNALYVDSYALGPSLYYGAGAGMMPTAMAVVSDLNEVCRNIQAGSTGHMPVRSYRRLADKPLNDYLVLRALEVAEKQQLPIQFHTGFGDADLDMLLANPLHMRPLFESGQYKHAPFVLLHASYPYVRELGYLASLYSNVWMDVGLAIPYVTLDIPALWRQAFSLAPTSKVLFSTDAYSIPEIFWLAARWGRWGLAQVLDELIALGAFNRDEALDAARQILGENSAKLYQVEL